MTKIRRRARTEPVDPARRRTNRLGVLVMLAVAVVVSIATVALPAQAWWQARGDAAELGRQLEALQAENTELERRKDALGTDLEIEQRARDEYDLVYPDEEPYAVLPTPERDAAWFHAWPL